MSGAMTNLYISILELVQQEALPVEEMSLPQTRGGGAGRKTVGERRV